MMFCTAIKEEFSSVAISNDRPNDWSTKGSVINDGLHRLSAKTLLCPQEA